jgi:uncharacterized paraquat-inducible protein A
MDFDDEDDLPEGPQGDDVAEDPAEILCPYCKREILEDSVRCPYCGAYLSEEDAPGIRRTWWWYVAVAVLILIILRYTVHW